MLILTRKRGERIFIGDEITVVINRIAGNRVVVGVEAPCHTTIQRCDIKSTARHSRVPIIPR